MNDDTRQNIEWLESMIKEGFWAVERLRECLRHGNALIGIDSADAMWALGKWASDARDGIGKVVIALCEHDWVTAELGAMGIGGIENVTLCSKCGVSQSGVQC